MQLSKCAMWNFTCLAWNVKHGVVYAKIIDVHITTNQHLLCPCNEERKKCKEEQRKHHGVVDKSFLEQQILGTYVVRKYSVQRGKTRA